MSDQIKAAVNNFQSVIKNAQQEVSVRHRRKITRDDKNTHQPEPIQPLGFGNFLEKANLTCTACEISQIQATKSIGRLHIAVRRREGEAWLYLYNDDEAVKARIKLDAVVNPFVPTEGASVFEDVVIADQHDGRVLYEQSRSGLRLTEVAEFIGKEPAVKQGSTNPVPTAAAKQTSTQDHEKQPVHIPSSVIETSIAGTTYKIFVQPLQLSLLKQQPVKVKNDKNDKSNEVEGGYQQESGGLRGVADLRLCAFGSFLFRATSNFLFRDRMPRASSSARVPQFSLPQTEVHDFTGASGPVGFRLSCALALDSGLGHYDIYSHGL